MQKIPLILEDTPENTEVYNGKDLWQGRPIGLHFKIRMKDWRIDGW